MSGLTRERGDTVIGPRTSQSVLSSLLYRLRANRLQRSECFARSREDAREETVSILRRRLANIAILKLPRTAFRAS